MSALMLLGVKRKYKIILPLVGAGYDQYLKLEYLYEPQAESSEETER